MDNGPDNATRYTFAFFGQPDSFYWFGVYADEIGELNGVY